MIVRNNLISGNLDSGLHLGNHFNTATGQIYAGANGAIVEGNKIGTNALGNAALANREGISISAPSVIIGGSTPLARNIIAANTGHGISLFINVATGNVPVGPGATGAVIKGNYIGVDATGNTLLTNGAAGIFSGVSNVTIGGPAAGDANLVVAAVNQSAIGLGRSMSSNVILSTGGNSTVQGNILGLAPSGARLNARGNPIGVFSSGNQILGNVIAGNGTGGVPTTAAINILANVTAAQPDAADNTVVKGNFIGTNAAGALGLHNFGTGISVGNASGTVIGGTTAADRNVIVGGNDIGVFISAGVLGTTSGTQIKGNYIGVMPDGVTAQDPANRVTNGVHMFTTGSGIITSTTIGGTTAVERNVIAGNSQSGIALFGGGINGNTISGNYIGVTAAATALGNSVNGVTISEAVNNTIGGSAAQDGNLIAHNSPIGVGSDNSRRCGQPHSVERDLRPRRTRYRPARGWRDCQRRRRRRRRRQPSPELPGAVGGHQHARTDNARDRGPELVRPRQLHAAAVRQRRVRSDGFGEAERFIGHVCERRGWHEPEFTLPQLIQRATSSPPPRPTRRQHVRVLGVQRGWRGRANRGDYSER